MAAVIGTCGLSDAWGRGGWVRRTPKEWRRKADSRSATRYGQTLAEWEEAKMDGGS